MKCFNLAETFTMVCQKGKYDYSLLRLSRVIQKIYMYLKISLLKEVTFTPTKVIASFILIKR